MEAIAWRAHESGNCLAGMSMDAGSSRYATAEALASQLGITKRAVNARAALERWPFKLQTVRGGRQKLYRVSALPEDVRRAVVHRLLDQQSLPQLFAAPSPNDRTQTQAAGLKDWQRARMEARAALLGEVERLACTLGVNGAIEELVERARGGELPEHLQRAAAQANAKAGGTRTLSVRTLKRWRAAQSYGLGALAPRGQREDWPEWGAALLKAYRRPQNPPLREAVEELAWHGALPQGVQPPSYDQARRFLRKVGEVEKRRGRMGPRELRSVRPFVRRDSSHMAPGDCYTADGHTFDAEVAHPLHGRPFRPEVTLVLDVATRRAVGWSCTIAENALAVLDALRHAAVRCGIPAILYTDNGPGYVNRVLQHPSAGILARLGTEFRSSIPYNSQARGLSERAHRTVLVSAARRMATYMGAAMDAEARKAAFEGTRRNSAGLIEWTDFCGIIDAALVAYNDRPHSALPRIVDAATRKRRHLSPREAWEGHIAQGWAPVFPDGAEDLFRPQVERVCQRGEVSLFGVRYFSRGLEEYHGLRVRVGYDVWDAGRVWVRNLEGVLVCVAEADANRRPYFPQSVIDRARDKRAKERLRRLEVRQEEILAELGREAEAEGDPLTAEERQEAAECFALLDGGQATSREEPAARGARPPFGTDAEKYRWLRAHPEACTEQDQEWIEDYRESSEYRLLFGEGAAGAQGVRAV